MDKKQKKCKSIDCKIMQLIKKLTKLFLPVHTSFVISEYPYQLQQRMNSIQWQTVKEYCS